MADKNHAAPIWAYDGGRFSSPGDAIVLKHDAALERAQGTVSFVFAADGTSGRQGLFSKDASGFGEGGHLGIWIERGALVTRLQSDDASHSIKVEGLTADEPHHVAVTFGGEGLRLYLDGELVGARAYAGGLGGNREPIVLGANQWKSPAGAADDLVHPFEGIIEAVRVHGEALSAADVASLASAALGGGSGEPAPAPEPEVTVDDPPVEKPAPDADDGANAAPVVVGELGTVTLAPGQSRAIDLDTLFSDADGDDLAYKLRRGPDFADVEADELILSPGVGDVGEHVVAVKALDADHEWVTLKLVLEVGGAGGASDPAPREPEPAPAPAPASAPASALDSGSGALVRNGTVKLEAGKHALSGPIGAQAWGKGVTLEGYDLSGKPAWVRWSNEHSDDGFGVAGKGSRWDGQIDYYESGGGRSERIVIDFGGPAGDVVVRLGMMGLNEGRIPLDDRADEIGFWRAYGADGSQIGTGHMRPSESRKESGSYGTYGFAVDVDEPVHRLAVEAAPWENSQGVAVSDERGYGENNSDVALMGVTFDTLDLL